MRFLVVEDDAASMKFMEKILSRYGETQVAMDGQQAMEKFIDAFEHGSPFDLVCLDIMLPKMDGQEVLKKIRAYEEAHGIGGLDGVKVIMTTALRDSGNIMTAFTSQCEAYLPKPIEKTSVISELRAFGIIS